MNKLIKPREVPVIEKSIWVKRWIKENSNSNIKINSKNMELKDYTTEELREEIKRRAELTRKQKAEEMKNALRCRNCVHCVPLNPSYSQFLICKARTWGKKYPRNYSIKPSNKACDKFERKID